MPRYRLIGRLESGELAELYKATRDDGTPVTLKMFHPRTSDAAYAQVLAETARVLNPLGGEGVVHFLDQGMVEGRLALVREYVDGFTLGVALQRLATKEVLLPPAVALHLVIHLLEVVQRGHDAGLVHGAITPGNVLLGFDGRGYLCDYGALRALHASPALRSLAGKGRGTYRAPEVGRGEEPTVESDVFSLGAIAYELLTLKELSPGKGMSVRREAVPPPSRLDRRINARLDPIVMRAVELLPARRYRACAEMAHALRTFLTASGGMPNREDVVKFVGELFPNEVRVETLGPVPFEGPFELEPVSGAALPSLEEVRPSGLHVRPSFTLEQPAVKVEGLVGQLETRDASAPAMPLPPQPLPGLLPERPPPQATSPARAPADSSRAATEWEAPAAAAAPSGPRIHRHGRTPASGSPVRPRQRAAEVPALVSDTAPDAPPAPLEPPVEHLPPPVEEFPEERPAASPRPADRAVISAKVPGLAQPRENVRTDTPVDPPAAAAPAADAPPRSPFQPKLAAMGVAVCLGIVVLVAILLRASPEEPRAESAEPSVVDGPAMAPRPIQRPVGVEPRPVGATRPEAVAGGFLSVDSNVPANLYVNGALKGRTPQKRIALPVGTLQIMLEAVDTGEQKEFPLEIEAGKERKVVEYFQSSAPVKRKR